MKPGSDPLAWCKEHMTDMRGVPGMRHVDIVKSVDDPSQWSAFMTFSSKKDLEAYKATGPYKSLVKSLQEEVIDVSKPVTDNVYELVDV
jgi:hypothetical protein